MNTDKHGSKGKSKKVKGKMLRLSFSATLRLCGVILCLSFAVSAQTKDYTRYVNPFIGTGGHGHTFPGATLPFGMVQLSPDTRTDNWDGSSGYHYSDDTIYGFSHTHLSGTGIPDGCDILLMPVVKSEMLDVPAIKQEGFPSKFSHQSERAEPGYYSVTLDRGNIFAEMTATSRVGLHRYTFPTPKPRTFQKNQILLDLTWRDRLVDSQIKWGGSGRRLEGFRRSSSWAKDQTVYFVIEFSKSSDASKELTAYLGYYGDEDNRKARWLIGLDEKDGNSVMVKVAISYVSIEGARKNLETELPHWDFDKVRADAKAAWNKELSKIEVSGGTPEQTTNFYTALYHTMIHPNVFNDVDGRYKGHDGKIHSLGDERQETGDRRQRPKIQDPRPKAGHYTVFSLWDTFRAAHPLYTIIDQKRTVDFINTFIRIYEQGGRLPVWELWGEETDTMIGYHAVSVIADAMAKGIKGFDYEKAYAAAKHSAELDHFGLAAYKKRGYISMEDENESVSKTLEYAYNDWCIAQMAKILLAKRERDNSDPRVLRKRAKWDDPYRRETGYYLEEDRIAFLHRARYFENLFDTKTGFFRPKKNGGFVEPFAPNEVTFGFTEGNSWQYSFFVPHDVQRLTELMGGREKFIAKLDELFTTDQKLAGREQADLTGLIGQYAHGNEPSHHIAYLYNYVGQPWKTQKYVRKIMDEFYKNAPDGLIGNEDAGQMSAWYILSASGFYPVAPGDGIYSFGTPLFPEVKYDLENGKPFIIRAKNISPKNIYILNAKLNGAPYKKTFITHAEIMRGGVLEFAMTDTPVTTAFSEFPVSGIYGVTTAVPVIDGERLFNDKTNVTMRTTNPEAMIFYTTDGSTPTRSSKIYFEPFVLRAAATIKAFTYFSPGNESPIVEARFQERPNDWTVKVVSGYSTQYTGGGENAIVDGIRGTVNFASGEWQGVQGKTYEAVIDLQRETQIKELGGSFLQNVGAWIWMPDRLEFEVSNDGVTFARISDFTPGFSQTEMKPAIREFRRAIKPFPARYVRVRAYNIGKIPFWHPGAGGDPWIFVDEIFIK